VLEHVRLGRTNAEIGEALGISADAAKYHVANMLSKLGLPDRRALAAWQPGEPAPRRWWGAALVGWAARGGRWVAAGVLAAVVAALVAFAFAFLRPTARPASVLAPTATRTSPTPSAVAGTATPSSTPAAPISVSVTPPADAPPSSAFPDGSIDVCVVDRGGGVDLRDLLATLETMDLSPIGTDWGLSSVGSRLTADCGADTSGWMARHEIDAPVAPGCGGTATFDMVLFLVPQGNAVREGSKLADRTGSTVCWSGHVGAELRQSALVGAAEAIDPVLMLRHFYYFFTGHPTSGAYVDGRCDSAGCGPVVPWAPVADAWRYTWPDKSLDVCVVEAAPTDVSDALLSRSITSLGDTDTGRDSSFSSVRINITHCGATPIFDPADGPPIRTKNRILPGRKTADLFVFLYPDAALADFGDRPVQRKVGQEWIQDGPDLRVATTGVYITTSELADTERLRALLGVALGMFKAR